jgi:two-component system NtrC family sensor kinase
MTAVIVMTGVITAVIGIYLINRGIINQVQDRVRNDLNAAREVLNSRLKELESAIYLSSLRDNVKDAIYRKERKKIEEYLTNLKRVTGLEILDVADAKGSVVFRFSNPSEHGDSVYNDGMIKKALDTGRAQVGTVIISRDELLREGGGFAERAHIVFINTPKAKKRPEAEETSGMMLKAAVPVFGRDNEIIGVIYGGDLINRDYRLVDKIKSIVYQGETYEGMDMGTATIFQKDLRISTNVLTDGGERAIGTRVSEEVYDRVLGMGNRWVDRAFVVNSWYITAYEPMRDIEGSIVGMLYVGLLEKKFVDIRTNTLIIFFVVTLLGMLLVMIASNIFANRITRPINYLVEVAAAISSGDFDVQVNVNSRDEIGKLEIAFNLMAAALRERDEELKNQTNLKLMRSEKLAALGRMAAGIAHEINNPLTGVLMYAYILLENMPRDSQERQDMEIIINETNRCREIIRDLLDFSRENVPEKKPVDINESVDKAISIIDKKLYFEKIEIVRDYSGSLPGVLADRNQLQQVFINLFLNAVEAMPDGGRLLITTLPGDDYRSVIIKIADTGSGIPAENIDKIFDPFFTTKEVGKGTGLGLAVTYGIIQKHGGQIAVESEPGRGTAFTIKLPVENF